MLEDQFQCECVVRVDQQREFFVAAEFVERGGCQFLQIGVQLGLILLETGVVDPAIRIDVGRKQLAAGKYNPKIDIGDAAPAWAGLPGVDGKEHSLADLEGKELVVVVFTCNSCEVAVEYEDRILDFARRYCGPDSRVALVAINVNLAEEDSLPKMKERAEARDFPFAYLLDETQQIARDYGAVFTPEFFVLDRDRKIAYMGGMDDASNAELVKQRYLAPAVEALLAGRRPKVQEAPAIGCTVRYSRRRARE